MAQPREGTDRILLVAAWVASVVALVAGAALFFGDLLRPRGFGWFAYQPLSGQTSIPMSSVLSATGSFGLVVMVLGIGGVCLLIGRVMGLREARRGSRGRGTGAHESARADRRPDEDPGFTGHA